MDTMMGMAELLPGKGLNLNTLGRNALIDTSDLDTQKVPFQDLIAFAEKINVLIIKPEILPLLLNTKLEKLTPIKSMGQSQSLLELQLFNLVLNERITLICRRESNISGAGQPNAIKPAKNRITIEDFFANCNKPEFIELLENCEVVAIKGAKDSGSVAIEQILGYYDSLPLSKRPEKILWYGQKSTTKEQYDACTRTRYAPLGVDFPREGMRTTGRIVPIPNFVKSDRISVGKIIIIDVKGKKSKADLLIDCSGLQNILKSNDGMLNIPVKKPIKATTQSELNKLLSLKLTNNSRYVIQIKFLESTGKKQEKLEIDIVCPRRADSIQEAMFLNYSNRIDRLQSGLLYQRGQVDFFKSVGKLDQARFANMEVELYSRSLSSSMEKFLQLKEEMEKGSIKPKQRSNEYNQRLQKKFGLSNPYNVRNSLLPDDIKKICNNLFKNKTLLNLSITRIREGAAVRRKTLAINYPLNTPSFPVLSELIYSGSSSSKKQIARKSPSYELYVAGPAAELKPSKRESQKIKALNVEENTVALWFHDERVEDLGIYQARADLKQNKLNSTIIKSTQFSLSPRVKPIKISVPYSGSDANLKNELTYESLLEFSLTAQLVEYFSDLGKVCISSFSRSQSSKNNEGFKVDIELKQKQILIRALLPECINKNFLQVWSQSNYFHAAVIEARKFGLKNLSLACQFS